MGIIREGILMFVTGIMAFVLVFFIIGLSLNSLLYPSPYIKSMHESGTFEYIEDQLKNTPGASFIKLPNGEVEPLVENLLTNLLSYIRSDSDELNLSVEVDKEKLRSFFLKGMENITVCSPEKLPDFENLEKLCLKVGQTRDDLLDELIEKG